jgi:F1F0 ATPase subunit 2
MSELLSQASVFASGLALGLIFFGGLWWTICRGLSAAQPALWFFGGLLLRMGVVLYGFYLVGGSGWERWMVCLSGFIAGRIVVRLMLARLPRPGRELGDAS